MVFKGISKNLRFIRYNASMSSNLANRTNEIFQPLKLFYYQLITSANMHLR